MGLRGYRNILMLTVSLLILMVASLFFGQADIAIGGKNFTEQSILVHMLSLLIEENTDLTVRQREFLGGTLVTFQALQQGSLDGYVEYTGTGLTVILDRETMNDPNQVYQVVHDEFLDRWNLLWLDPLGFNNTYVLTMRQEHVGELGVSQISDLLEHAPNLTLGSTHEFLERADGYPGLAEHYGFQFSRARPMDPGLTYQAVRAGEVDVIDGFATDGRIAAFNLEPLADDRQYFPPYFAAPLFRMETLERYPEIRVQLRRLAGKLNDQTMRSLNFEVDSRQRDPITVAREWLTREGLI